MVMFLLKVSCTKCIFMTTVSIFLLKQVHSEVLFFFVRLKKLRLTLRTLKTTEPFSERTHCPGIFYFARVTNSSGIP